MPAAVIERVVEMTLAEPPDERTHWVIEIMPRRRCSGYHVLRLGDGRFALGRSFMHGVIRQMRAQRIPQKAARNGFAIRYFVG